MSIEDSALERPEGEWSQLFHVTRQEDDVDVSRRQDVPDRGVQRGRIVVRLRRQVHGVNPGLASPPQGPGVAVVAHDHSDTPLDAAVGKGVKHALQRRPLMRGENSNVHGSNPCGAATRLPFVFIMARRRRVTAGGYAYHVCNRGSRKGVILETYEDYANFIELVNEARQKFRMRILAYNLLGNHFHFVLWPVCDNDLPRFMKRLEQRHAQRFHRKRGTRGSGAVFQSRYQARILTEARKLFSALRYVDGNARRHGFVTRAEDWPWSSACTREPMGPRIVIDASPVPRPSNWLDFINDF